MIVLGGPGTGKSGAAILTMLQALRHRQSLTGRQRQTVPVPVLLTPNGWNPTAQRLDDWLASRIDREYPFLRSGGYGDDTPVRLVRNGMVALVLDGFDEIPNEFRSTALLAIDQQVTFRIVLLSRTSELVDATANGHLQSAAALELVPISRRDAAEYLVRCQAQPIPEVWQRLTDYIRLKDNAPLSTALDTPLMVTLVRDTFSDPAELIDLLAERKFRCRAEIEAYLIGRVLPWAYRQRPGERVPYKLEDARRWLAYLATEMNQRGTSDLAWWQIRSWAPFRARFVTIAFSPLIGFGCTIGPIFSALFGVAGGIIAAIVSGAAVGLTVGALESGGGADLSGKTSTDQAGRPGGDAMLWSAVASAAGITAGLAFGIAVGVRSGPIAGVLAGLSAGLAFGIASGSVEVLMRGRRSAGPRRFNRLRPKAVLSAGSIGVALAFGLVFGLSLGFTLGPGAGLGGGLIVAIAGAVLFGLASGLVAPSTADVSPMDPLACWRSDRLSGTAEGLAYALTSAVAMGVVGALVASVGVGIKLGLVIGVGEAIAFPLAMSQAWLASQNFLLLGCTGVFPRDGMRFLEDARRRGVLRTVGSVYQFRHARLQDHLAGSVWNRRTP